MAKGNTKLKAFVEKHHVFCEIVRFLIVGGIATVVDMFVMGLVLYAFDPSLYPKFYNIFYGGGQPSTAATVVGTGCGFIAGLIVNYVLSIFFVFEHKGKSKSAGGFLIFTLLSAVGLGIHLLGMYLGYTVIGINEWIVKIVLTVIVLIYNYVSKRLLLFKKSKTESETDTIENEEKDKKPETQDALYIRIGKNNTDKIKISMIVPCYNEEACIEKYYDAMQQVVASLPVNFEYIFVDDGSRDNTLNLIRKLAKQDGNVRYISFSRNFGKEAAMLAGLKAASGDLVGLMDVDLQDPPAMLADMYNGIVNEGYDCVSCRRTDRKGESKIRSAFARLFYKLINKMSDADITDGARDYRLMSRKMTNAVLDLTERERFSKGIFGWVGFKTKWLEYKNTERVAGSTKWSFKKLTKYAIGGIEDFSTAPLKINFILSSICFFAALFFAVFDIVWACTGHGVGAVLTLLPIVTFIASLLFLGIGVVGEYVKKIFYEVKARPVYLVRETEEFAKYAEEIKGEENVTEEIPDSLAEVASTTEEGK